jgi:hypothetical protein
MRNFLVVLPFIFTSMTFAQSATSAFYPEAMVARARANAEKSDWGRTMRDHFIAAAQPWMKMSDDELWDLMFGPTITRSWHVWSNGFCPACKQPVPMYNWAISGMEHPWKVQCPNCKEFFPKNDFPKFYKSGLDEHGVFDPKKADRSLLFNAEHPDPKDPLHNFGVDDGEGYVEGNNRWHFIGAYLIYGQWKQVILSGAKNLAAAYLMSGDEKYAHKAAILLDRIADLYPTFDFMKQGLVYEIHQGDGYVSVWHDANVETRFIALTYDAIKPAIARDQALADFLQKKHEQFKTPLDKSTPAKVMENIETRIFKDAIAQTAKIHSNYPQQPLTIALMHAAMGWPANREAVLKELDPVIEQSTAVDGVTGEKGLANYSAYAAYNMAAFLGYFAQADPNFLPEMVKRHPRLPDMWRFFIDTWCFGTYYPLSGDTGINATPQKDYMGVQASPDHGLAWNDKGISYAHGLIGPSMYSFLWQLYKITGDERFAQVLYGVNKNTIEGLPWDLFADDPAKMENEMKSVIDKVGPTLRTPSVNKQQWCLAILRSGNDKNPRALWLDYDAGGTHGHFDGMNLGLFAKGLDLMPDYGYPQVQFGGWTSPKARWYIDTPSHNTVIVDAKNHNAAQGKTTLWTTGKTFNAITASAPALIGGQQFERTAASVNIDDDDFYVVDIFRVVGGHDQVKMFHSHFGTITTNGLNLSKGEPIVNAQLMRNFQTDAHPQGGWSVDWKINDLYKLLPEPKNLHVRYTDLTRDATATTCEGWCVAGSWATTNETWVPRVLVRRKSTGSAPLASTFVSVIEPYEGKSKIKSIRRLPIDGAGENCVAIQVDLVDGRSDLIMSKDVENPLKLPVPAQIFQSEWKVKLNERLGFVRRDANGKMLESVWK